MKTKNSQRPGKTPRWGTHLLSSCVLTACAALLVAASCQEKQAPSESKVQVAAVKTPPGDNSTPSDESAGHVFEPQVAGGFYPANPGKLRSLVSEYLDTAGKAGKKVEGDLLGIMVPHAGYPYSGPVAAHAFALLRGRKVKRVVVLGPAHRRAYPLPALLDAASYRTPLGAIPIDRDGVERLAATGAARVDEGKFLQEHALEVELPFLQVALGDFFLVPVMISGPDPAAAGRLAKALKETFPSGDTLFVASTDMSHDYAYDVAKAMDENAMRLVSALDTQGLIEAYQSFRKAGTKIKVGAGGKPEPDCAQLCGLGPVLTLLYLAKEFGEAKVDVLDLRNSGDIVGDKKSRIVGYGAAAVTLAVKRPEGKESHAGSTGEYLNREEKLALLKIARESLQHYFEKGEKKVFEPKLAKLNAPGAAFVTLKRHGQLRGCIGYMEPVDPLWKMIRDRAIDAAIHDSRFRPVTAQELPDITVEISVLTPRVPVKDPLREIVIGRDGVWLEIGHSRGVFLPQVPIEQNWKTVEVYLDHLCRKAHVPQAGCWKSEQARIMRFEALVFSEQE
jgi:MEMO1 family protein